MDTPVPAGRNPKLWVFAALLVLSAALLVAVFPYVRESARRSQCAKRAIQIVDSQTMFVAENLGQMFPPYIQGAESFCRTEGRDPPPNATTSTDASRAFMFMAKKAYNVNLLNYACPSDPFVAGLDTAGAGFTSREADFPVEGTPIGTGTIWTNNNSSAAKEPGHTWFSYSMQSGSADPAAMLGPKMHAKIPVVGERNPWSVATALGMSELPTDHSTVGNSWNHNRDGNTLAFADGHSEFLAAANALELPSTPTSTDTAYGYLYGPWPPTPAPVPSPKGSCPPRDGYARLDGWGAWLTD